MISSRLDPSVRFNDLAVNQQQVGPERFDSLGNLLEGFRSYGVVSIYKPDVVPPRRFHALIPRVAWSILRQMNHFKPWLGLTS